MFPSWSVRCSGHRLAGFVRRSGRCLAGSVRRLGRRLAGSVRRRESSFGRSCACWSLWFPTISPWSMGKFRPVTVRLSSGGILPS